MGQYFIWKTIKIYLSPQTLLFSRLPGDSSFPRKNLRLPISGFLMCPLMPPLSWIGTNWWILCRTVRKSRVKLSNIRSMEIGRIRPRVMNIRSRINFKYKRIKQKLECRINHEKFQLVTCFNGCISLVTFWDFRFVSSEGQ